MWLVCPFEKGFTDHGGTKDFSDSGVWLREGKDFTAPLSPGPWTGLYSTFCGILEMFEIWFIHTNKESGMGKHINKYSNTNQVMVDACATYNAMVEWYKQRKWQWKREIGLRTPYWAKLFDFPTLFSCFRSLWDIIRKSIKLQSCSPSNYLRFDI